MDSFNGVGGESKRSLACSVIMLGTLWGVLESMAGIALRGTCAQFYSGSILMGCSLFFFSCTRTLTGGWMALLLLPVLAGILRAYTGVLLGQPFISGAVANPIYAFFTEAAAFCAVVYMSKEAHLKSIRGGAVMGMATAVVAANLFLPVKLLTGIPACVVPGTGFPLVLQGLPVAMAISAVSVPMGFGVGDWIARRMKKAEHRRDGVLCRVSMGITACCVVLLTIVNGF